MTEFTREAAFSAEDSAVGKDACAHSFRNIYDHQVVHAVAVAKPDFRECAGVGHVVHNNGQAGGLFDARFDGPNRPVDIGREDRLVEIGLIQLKVKPAGKTDADAVERTIAVTAIIFSIALRWRR